MKLFLSALFNAKLPFPLPLVLCYTPHAVTPFSVGRTGLWGVWGDWGWPQVLYCVPAAAPCEVGSRLLGQPVQTAAEPSSGPLGLSTHILSTDLSYLSRTS